MKLNNKGFAITAVLYGLLLLFVILVSSYLLVLSAKKDRVDTLTNEIETNYNQKKLVQHIRDLYNTNLIHVEQKDISGNVVTVYNYNTEESLMNDRLGGVTSDYNAGNIRYYGANPNNYVYFNCDNYDNPTSDTCELWRIIGVFDDNVKILRYESIGEYSWDYKSTGTYNHSWKDSSLMTLLNDGYYNNKDGINYYNNSTTATTINFASSNKGIKNEYTREMISESIWPLLYKSDALIYPNNIYIAEKNIEDETNQTWAGNIALIYASDYAYASNLEQCNQMLLCYAKDEYTCEERNWDFDTHGLYCPISNMGNTCRSDSCTSTNWIYNGENQWSLTVDTNETDAWGLMATGNVSMGLDDRVYNRYHVHPTLYLKSNIKVTEGKGTQEEPYQISM